MSRFEYRFTDEELSAIEAGPGQVWVRIEFRSRGTKYVERPKGQKTPPSSEVVCRAVPYVGNAPGQPQVTCGWVVTDDCPKPVLTYQFWNTIRKDDEALVVEAPEKFSAWAYAVTKPIGRARVGLVKWLMKRGQSELAARRIAANKHPYGQFGRFHFGGIPAL